MKVLLIVLAISICACKLCAEGRRELGLDKAAAPLPVTIRSDADSVVCANSSITLTCVATGGTDYKWTTSDDVIINSNNTDSIAVTATPEAKQYTCTATDDDGNTGRATITVASNDYIPLVEKLNFHEYLIVYVNGSRSLKVKFSANVRRISWIRKHAQLPSSFLIETLSIGGENYSSLILSNMAKNDWGIYIFTATSICGYMKSVNVTIDVKSGEFCFEGPVPILSSTPNQTTVRGEVVTFRCVFGGSYTPDSKPLYSIYWSIMSNGQTIHVEDSSNQTGYAVAQPLPNCPGNNKECCQFISSLQIITSTISILDGSIITCSALFRGEDSTSNISSLSIVDPPKLDAGPHVVMANLHEAADITFTFTSSQIPRFSVCAWSDKNGPIIFKSSKYLRSQISQPGTGNKVACKLTVLDVTQADEGRYFCYCHFNQSFWKKYNFPKYSNISSQQGEATIQLIKNTKHHNLQEILEIAGPIIGLIFVVLIALLFMYIIKKCCKNKQPTGYTRVQGEDSATTTDSVPVVASDNETLPFPLQVTNDDTQPTNEISDPATTQPEEVAEEQTNEIQEKPQVVVEVDNDFYYSEPRSVPTTEPPQSAPHEFHENVPLTLKQLAAEKIDGYATGKMALLIGNSNYQLNTSCLSCPRNDVKTMEKKLQEDGFKTLSLVDLTRKQMSRAIHYFCSLLFEGMYIVFYYSGHGVGDENTTLLMPIDADGRQVKVDEYINYNAVRQKLQRQHAIKLIAILDCCRTKGSKTIKLTPTDSVTDGENFHQIHACAPNHEAYEFKGWKHSFLTQGIIEALNAPGDKKKINGTITDLIMKYHKSKGKPFPKPWILHHLAEDISLQDPIHVLANRNEKTNVKDLILELPGSEGNVQLEFNDSTMSETYGHIQLRFRTEFSNVIIVHITCDAVLRKHSKINIKMDVQDLKNLGLTVTEVDDATYKIGNLLVLKELCQTATGTSAQLKLQFHSPINSTMKDIVVYELPNTLINPTF